MMTRRRFLSTVPAGVLASISSRSAWGRGRAVYGSTIEVHVPWPTGSVDPHRIDDAMAAFFGEALFDTLYARDDAGTLVASLAAADPVADGANLRVPLRRGVRFASGGVFDARAAAASIGRARAHDAAGWLVDVPAPRAADDALVFAMRDPHALVRALASPLVAMVPARFSPDRPDGTGPFRVEPLAGALRLVRNGLAATGPSLLDSIDVRRAPDLATPLRAFESGADDVGWLGSFLHEPRPGARTFDAGAVAWAILRTGRQAGALDVPGGAQSLADGVSHAALASFVVGPSWDSTGAQWTGAPSDLLVRDDSPWLVEVARALAIAMSSSGHEITARPAPPSEIAQRRAARSFVLMLDVARAAGPGALGMLVGLATADDPESAAALMRHPLRGDLPARNVTRTMRVGVVGEVRLEGGRAPDLILPPSSWGRGIDWGSAYRLHRQPAG